MNEHTSAPQWYVAPASGRDLCDAKLLAQAITALDQISAPHRSEAFLVLSMRYTTDLEKMVAEERARKAGGA